MKSILVPVENHNTMASVLSVAALAGHHLDGKIDGVALRAMQLQVAGTDPIIAVSVPPSYQDEKETLEKARALFEARAAATAENANRMLWTCETTIDDSGLGCLARVYDLTVIGRPSVEHGGARMTTLEAVLFDSGRPILIAPPQAATGLGKNVVISWNCSTEAARTLAFAMPFLHKADKVSVLTIEEAVVTGPSGEEICANLSANGIEASNYVVSAKSHKPGAVILAESANLGCDLLIKSAYTQSRLRQMIFGGATNHILYHANLPVFMAN